MLRGLDDKRRLLAFFGAKEHHNLVLRIVDVLELRNDQQDYLIHLCRCVGGVVCSCVVGVVPMNIFKPTRKDWFLYQFPRGYVVLPIDRLLEPMSLEDVVKLQEVTYNYTDIRRQKGEPHRTEPCPKCRGEGRLGGRLCPDCQGDGTVITFIEMSPEEQQLAVGQ